MKNYLKEIWSNKWKLHIIIPLEFFLIIYIILINSNLASSIKFFSLLYVFLAVLLLIIWLGFFEKYIENDYNKISDKVYIQRSTRIMYAIIGSIVLLLGFSFITVDNRDYIGLLSNNIIIGVLFLIQSFSDPDVKEIRWDMIKKREDVIKDDALLKTYTKNGKFILILQLQAIFVFIKMGLISILYADYFSDRFNAKSVIYEKMTSKFYISIGLLELALALFLAVLWFYILKQLGRKQDTNGEY